MKILYAWLKVMTPVLVNLFVKVVFGLPHMSSGLQIYGLDVLLMKHILYKQELHNLHSKVDNYLWNALNIWDISEKSNAV